MHAEYDIFESDNWIKVPSIKQDVYIISLNKLESKVWLRSLKSKPLILIDNNMSASQHGAPVQSVQKV